MKNKNKAKIASTVLVIIYLISAFIVYEYFALSKIDGIINYPFTIALALTYGLGGAIGLLFYLLFLILLWVIIYFILIKVVFKSHRGKIDNVL